MRWTWKITCLAMLLAVLQVGCEKQEVMPVAAYSDDWQYLEAQRGPGLVIAEQHAIPDVPVPVRFVGVATKSSYEPGPNGTRIVDYLYQGRGTLGETVTFFRRNLTQPAYGWTFVREDIDSADFVNMTFTKGPETLRLRINERATLVSVVITIGPTI